MIVSNTSSAPTTDIFAQSTFNSSAEGWQVQIGYPTASEVVDAHWYAGYINWSNALDSSVRDNVFFKAPAAFTGDLSGCYGQTFEFGIFLELGAGSTPDSFYDGPQGVVFQGNGVDLWIPAPVQDTYENPSLAPHQRVSVTLTATPECRLSTTDKAPTEAEFKAILGSVSALLVRAAWYPGTESFKTNLEAEVTLFKQTGGGLDPMLTALQGRLQGAISDDQLTLDATTLGGDGAAIVTLMQAQFGVDSLIVSSNVALAPTGNLLQLSADALQGTVAGVTQTAISSYFGVGANGLTIQLQIDGGTGWTVSTTFPALAQSWAGTLAFVTEADNDTLLVLASDAGALVGGVGFYVAEGLNLKGKIDVANGSAKALSSIVTGLTEPLTVIGPSEDTDTAQSFDIAGTLPDFSMSPPLLPELQFISPYVRAYAFIGDQDTVHYYQAYTEAGADITLGGVSLPLMIRIPTAVEQWQMGIIPGRFVPISDLAGFFGAFTGLELLTNLPSAVQGLNKFGLQNFILHLSPDLTDFVRLTLAFGTPPEEEGQNVWTIIPGTGDTPILALTGLSFALDISKKGSATKTSGSLSGSFNLSDTLALQARIALPIGEGVWSLSAQSGAALPNLQDFARFLGGQSLADLVPNGLGALTSYKLNDLTIVYNPAQPKLTRFSLAIASAEDWTIVDGQLVIKNVLMQMAMDDPLGGSSPVTGRIAGTIAIGEKTEVTVDVYRAVPSDPWRLSIFTDVVPLPSLGDITSLAGGTITALVPDTMRDNSFSLSDIVIQADISNAKMEKLGFQLSTSDTWTIITDVLAVTEAGIFFSLDWTTTPGTRHANGSIWGDVQFCQADFWLQADMADDAWTLSVKLMEGSELTLEHLVDAFDESLWAGLSNLNVPNIALKAASATYETATGNYAFSGEIGPGEGSKWTIPVGVTDISIESLGGAVTCARGTGGTATDKKVYVTGAFSVGSVHFSVKYLAGENLTIDCTLVGEDPVSAADIVSNLCSSDAGSVTWTSAFEALDQIHISDASAQIVLGQEPSFMLSGKISIDTTSEDGTLGTVDVAALFIVKEIKQKWEFAIAIRIDADWSLSGFNEVFDAFKIDKTSWMLVASSFTESGFTFPPSFPTPQIAKIERGLDFYGSFSIEDTLETIQGVITVLPDGTITETTLTVHGHLADPLSGSYLEILLVASAEGVPLLGWDDVRLSEFGLRLTAVPSFALHGDFIIRTIKNPDGSFFHLIIDLAISMSEVSITFEKQPGGDAIFTWQDAFGIDALDVSLTDLALGIVFEPPALDGTIGGQVDFEHQNNPTNSLFKNAAPHPVSVTLMESRRAVLATAEPGKYGDHLAIDYGVPYDQDGIEVYMKVSLMIVVADPPVPYPYELAGRFINFTLPYILKRFANVDVPPLLMPIQFPDIEFDFKLPDPSKPGKLQDLQFMFKGTVIIFTIHGSVDAEFDETRIKFIANSDPIVFKVDGTTIVAIVKSKDDFDNGPDIDIDSSPPAGQPQVGGDYYCNFFNFVDFGGSVEVLIDETDPAKSRFKYYFVGDVGQLANLSLSLVYQDMNYLDIEGAFHLGMTTDSLPGFSKDSTQIAEKIDLSKYKGDHGKGAQLIATLVLKLDARNPTNPDFTMRVEGYFWLNITDECKFKIDIGFDMDVNKDSMADIPGQVLSQMASNVEQLFGALLSTAQCFEEILKIGLFVLEETAKIAAVLDTIFETGIDLGSKVLHGLEKGAEDVADALWSIFGSHNSKKNTKAMKHGGYDSDQTGKAIKQTSDNHGQPYTASNLVHDQASAGYAAMQVASGLCFTFTDYTSKPVDAGQLLANQTLTSFQATEVANALKAQYAAQTGSAQNMFGLLSQIYKGSSALGPQEMADALAPLYSAVEVAGVLHNHYPNDTQTAAAMAGYILPAFQKAGKTLAVGDVAAALAPLYVATEVAPVLHDNFGADTGTAEKLGAILKTAYAATSSPLDANVMAAALATVFTKASDIVTALQGMYPDDTDTAMKMAAILIQAYPGLLVTDMAAALAIGNYTPQSIAAALLHHYHTDVGTPEKMTKVLAAQHYTPPEVAPILKTLFPEQCATAQAVASVLTQGYGAGQIDAPTMASALAAAPFTAPESAPVLKNLYAGDTGTAPAMATLLITAYQDGQGKNTITAEVMAQALAASPYDAGGDDGVAKVLIANYPDDTGTALAMSKLLKQAPYAVDSVGPVLKVDYSDTMKTAPDLAAVLAQTPFAVQKVAPVLKSLFADPLQTAAEMYGVLTGAYTDPVIGAQDMAKALAASPYAVTETAPVLKQNYETDTGKASDMYALLIAAYISPAPTAQEMATALAASPYDATAVAPLLKLNYGTDVDTATKMATLLHTAYSNPEIDLTGLLAALVAVSFNAYETAPAIKSLYSPSPEILGTDLVAAMQGTAPLLALPLGVALTTAPFEPSDVAKGVKAGLSDTPAGEMAAMLILVEDDKLTPALLQAAADKAAGNTIAAAAPKIVQGVSGVSGAIVVTALGSVFTPPNPDPQTILDAATAAFDTPDPESLADGTLTNHSDMSADTLLQALQSAFQSAGKTLSPADGAAAVAKAFAFIGKPLSQTEFAKMVVGAYGGAIAPVDLAKAVVKAFGTNTTSTQLVDDLKAGFDGTQVIIDAFVSAEAIQQALALAPTAADKLLPAIADGFGLTVLPNDVGALTAALKVSGFTLNAASAAFSAYFGDKWTPVDWGLAGAVYSKPEWDNGISERKAGKTVEQTAPVIYAANTDCGADLMVQVLVGVFQLTIADTAVEPMAKALKVVIVDGQKVYTVNEVSASMAAQYGDGWTPDDWRRFIEIYNA